jgi:hypothetical protein
MNLSYPERDINRTGLAQAARRFNEYGREIGIGECADIALDQHLGPSISGLWVGPRLLTAFAAVLRGTIDAAGRGINKTRDTACLHARANVTEP